MTVYPSAIDDDTSIIRIDDNISELGDTAINQLREAVFAIEQTTGINPQGALSSLSNRLNISLNADGTIKSSALSSIGLVTLPITNTQIASNAGIDESKLNLTYTTPALYSSLSALSTQVTNLSTLAYGNYADIRLHISGSTFLFDGLTPARHVISQIDINTTPTDSRDPTITWSGLNDQYGNPLIYPNQDKLIGALWKINYDFRVHQSTVSSAHPATAITVDASNFTELSTEITNVQEALAYIDDIETKSSGFDRATLNSNGIVRETRNQSITLPDGYSFPVVPATTCYTYLGQPNQQAPNDSVINGDDVIRFLPDNTNYVFDSQFTNVVPGDMVRVNYLNGITGIFEISSIRFLPGSEWIVRINGTNLANRDGYDGYVSSARIDRPRFDTNTKGVLACAPAVPNVSPSIGCNIFASSVIVGSQRGATAVGIALDPAQLDGYHYNLYLRMYPTGDSSVYIDLPPIDVTGNMGATPGYYNLDIIIEETNKKFRYSGYNYRFIAFDHKGEFGLMLADAINNTSFSIINGAISGTSIVVGSYTNNVINELDGYDGLGLGSSKAGLASPIGTFTSSAAAAGFSTIIISPIKQRNSLINGVRRDFLPASSGTSGDGYYVATVSNYTDDVLDNTKIVVYTINSSLLDSGVRPGKSIVVQPIGTPTTDGYLYGRFLVGDVSYVGATTKITVINGLHATVDPLMTSYNPIGTSVKIYAGADSVTFDSLNLAGAGTYHRYHEIMADQYCNTFAVERARMIKQSQTVALLDTTLAGWRIRDVSSKFTGYRTSGSDFRHFVRLVIYSYSNGVFDGYLAEPLGTYGVTNVGPMTRGLKNHPVRFYDSSYVNYIDIEFRETNTSPGSTILPDTVPRIVDIEIFPSVISDSENFVLAGVSHNEREIVSITDLREFGTISERNFTDSAIQYIEAGERHLHSNGVVRGFEYISAGLTDGVLDFKGGCALVDGRFVSVDACSVKLPAVLGIAYGAFICVNKDGNLVAVVKKSGVGLGSEQFDSVTNSFIETLSFRDIIDNRKDLCIVAYADYYCLTSPTRVSIFYIKDARRFVVNESINHYSLCNDGYYSASFHTLRAVEVWSDEYKISNVAIKSLTFNGVGDSFTPLIGNSIVFEGGFINIVNVNTGLTINSSVTLKNCTITYAPNVSALVAGDIINCNIATDSAIRLTNSSDQTVLSDNSFYCSSLSLVRPPFIGYFESSGTLENLVISNNIFYDRTAIDNAAIAFVSTNATGSTYPTLKNCIISGNVAKQSQALYISSRTVPSASVFGSYDHNGSFAVNNVKIENNRFGAIGLLTTGISTGDGIGLNIVGNIVDVIANAVGVTLNNASGTDPLSVDTYGADISAYGSSYLGFNAYAPEIKVLNNNIANCIRINSAGFNSVMVCDNTICKNNNTSVFPKMFFHNWMYNSLVVAASDCAIVLSGSSTGVSATCNNNIIRGNAGFEGNVISVLANANVIGNVLNDCFSGTTAIGIRTTGGLGVIEGNTIVRGSIGIQYYISAATGTNVEGNMFDQFWVSGAAHATGSGMDFATIGGSAVARNNVNQTTLSTINHKYAKPVFIVSGAVPNIIYNTFVLPSAITTITYIQNQNASNKISFTINSNTTCGLIFNFTEALPRGIIAHSISFDWVRDNAPSATSAMSIYLNKNSVDSLAATAINLVTTASGTFNWYNGDLATGVRDSIANELFLLIDVLCVTDGSTTMEMTISNLTVRWSY